MLWLCVVAMWFYGLCGATVMWWYRCVVLWVNGAMFLWCHAYGDVVLWVFGAVYVVLWISGAIIMCCYVYMLLRVWAALVMWCYV